MNDRQLHQIASALRAVACCATSDWSMLPRLPAVFLDGQVGHSPAVGAMRVRPAEVAELVRLDFHLDNLVASHCETVSLLRLELEPFIIGVGKVRVRDSTEGIVVALADDRQAKDWHVVDPPSSVATPCRPMMGRRLFAVTLGTWKWKLRTFPPRWTSAITACFLAGGS
jgi:hypothetical protein